MHVTMQDVLLSLFVAAAFFTDMKSMRIPNALTVSGAVTGIAYHTIVGGWAGFKFAGLGLAVGFGSLLLLHVIGALGAGDVKLFASIGALTGTPFVLHCLVYSIVYAGAIGAIVVLLRKRWFRRMLAFFCFALVCFWTKDVKNLVQLKLQASLRFPFMYAVLPAVMTTWAYSIT